MLTAAAFVDKLLERDGPVWHRWNRDLPGLVEALKTLSRDLSSVKPATQSEASEHAARQECALWLLDRLLPQSEAYEFETSLNNARGIYAWARRLPPEKRGELTRFPVMAAVPGRWDRRKVFEALLLGWCESCPDDHLSSLLEWPEHWKSALEYHDVCWLPHPEEEFYRRCESIEERRAAMIASLQRNLPLLESPNQLTKELAGYSARPTFRLLLRDIAIQSPCAEPQPLTDEAWDVWFKAKLESPAVREHADLGHNLLKAQPYLRYLAQSFWIWLHGKDDWESLYSGIGFSFAGDTYFEQLGGVVPPEKLDIWDGLVMNESRFERIHAFCQWLPPKYAEVLRDHFNHPDRDWAACAYQNYLAKTPEPILQHWFKLFDDLPGWQLALLDRRLFAPEAIRPASLLEDIQTVEGDLRLEDPFNHRGY